MATRPTRIQQRIAEDLAEALVLIADAAQRDGSAHFGRPELDQTVDLLERIATGFTPGEIVSRALRRKTERLGMTQMAFEILSLVACEIDPRTMLLMRDDELRELASRLESELGEF